jgi:transcriptional regulator with PAS, ATPase and Fis domain
MAKSAAEILALIEDLRTTLVALADDAELARNVRAIVSPRLIPHTESQVTVDLDRPLHQILDGIKRIVVERALRQHREGSYRQAARSIGVPINTLLRWAREYKLVT